jgi:hypothetical protein
MLRAVVLQTVLFLLTSAEVLAGEAKNSPAKVEPIEGSEILRVTLTELARQRLGIETAPVDERPIIPRGTLGGVPELRKVIAYSAVIYDTTGRAWAYTSPKPLVYVRQPISIEYSEGNHTILHDGPPTGTEVVVVGAAELYGTETGVK